MSRRSRLTIARVLGSSLPRGVVVTPSLSRVMELSAEEMLGRAARAARAARARAPFPQIGTVRLDGDDPAAELIGLAGEDDEVVVGSRGHGGFASLTLGSVAGRVAAHARGPVVVVRGHARPRGRVVVGVDGSARGEDALAYGFDHADRHGLPLCGVHAYRFALPLGGPHPALPEELAEMRRYADQLAGEAVRRWAEKYPDVDTTWDTDLGSAAATLVDASEDASLVVVGSRGHGGIAGLVLGSVGQALLRHVHCPVAVAR